MTDYKDLIARLRRGFGSSAGRVAQLGAYKRIGQEAADALEELTAPVKSEPKQLEVAGRAKVLWAEGKDTDGNKIAFYPESRVRELEQQVEMLRNALNDMNSGWKYIRETHGDLYGVGWDRAQTKAEHALAATEGEKQWTI